jgi:RIP metalloprotease RseP
MPVLQVIAVLALLIFVHELGHFMAARLQGIYANRFSIGFGPILWKYQGAQTEYALRALPLGGFVGFPDDDPDSHISPNDPNLLRNRPLLDRAIVISAGVIANLLFAYFVLVVQAGAVGAMQASQPGVKIAMAVEVSQVSAPASQAGVRVGDMLFVDGRQLNLAYNLSDPTGKVVAKPTQKPIRLSISRKNPDPNQLAPELPAGVTETGLQFIPNVALKAGLQPGDVVLSANGQTFGHSPNKEEETFRQLIELNAGKPIQLQVKRGSELTTLKVTPVAEAGGKGKIGVGLGYDGELVRRRSSNLIAAFSEAADEFQRIVMLTVQGFGQLISNFSNTANQVAGPVKIVSEGAKIAKSDVANLFNFAALISINLAIINILPLPALDGGQLVFLLLEGLSGKPLPTRIQDGVMQTGLLLILGLGTFLIIRDTSQLVQEFRLFR